MDTWKNNLIMERHLLPGTHKGCHYMSFPLGTLPGTHKGCHYMSFPLERYVVASLVGARQKSLAVVLAVAALFSMIFLSLAAHAAGTGRIYGQLLDGTNKNAPLARQSVTLQMAQGNSARDLASIATDARGSYTFGNLATDKTISYALYMRYQGAQYTSNVITLDTKPVQQLNLTVYEATTSTANMAIIRATI